MKPGALTTEFLGPHAVAAALCALAWDSAQPELVRAFAAIGAALAVAAYPRARATLKELHRRASEQPEAGGGSF